MTDELTGRYEEIDLLYAISEILGHTVRLEEAAQTIVREVADAKERPRWNKRDFFGEKFEKK